MEMERRLGEILDALKDPVVAYNAQKPERFGVAIGENAVMAASSVFVVTIENAGLKNKYPRFFSYIEDKFGEYTYPITEDQILFRLKNAEFSGSAVFPISNIINRLQKMADEGMIAQTSVVFNHGYMEDDDILLSFKNKRSEAHPFMIGDLDAGKEIVLDEKSSLKDNEITPGSVYRCKEVKEDSDTYYVDVVEPAGYIRCGIHYAASFWHPDMYEPANKMTGYIPPTMMVGSIANHPDDLKMKPVHLDGPLFLQTCKSIGLFGTMCEVAFPKDPNSDGTFAIVKTIPEKEDDPIVTVYIATKDRTAGIQPN